MKKIYFSIVCACLLMITFSNCTEDNLSQNEFADGSRNLTVEQSNVLNVINEFANRVNSGNTLRSSSEDKITLETITKKTYSFNPDKDVATRSTSQYQKKNIPDTAMVDLYTVTFSKSGKKGFSIASTDERVKRVYAYTESGQLSDTTYNWGLSVTLAGIPSVIEEDLNLYYSGEMGTMANRLGLEDVNISPLISSEWNQDYPYNKFCPDGCPYNKNTRGHCYAGCVAIATAQVILKFTSGFGVPRILEPDDEMVDGFANTIYMTGINVRMNYGCEESGAYVSNVSPYMNFLGFSTRYANEATNFNNVIKNMKNGYPHIIAGSSDSGRRHAWIWDGIQGKTMYSLGRYSGIGPLTYHYNWGWGPHGGNGWFAKGYQYPHNQEQVYISGYSRPYRSNSNDVNSVLELMRSYNAQEQ